MKRFLALSFLLPLLLCGETISFSNGKHPETATVSPALRLTPRRIALANGKQFSLNLPEGFDIKVAQEGLRRVRFMALSPDNRIFVTDMYNRADNKRGAV